MWRELGRDLAMKTYNWLAFLKKMREFLSNSLERSTRREGNNK
ncbi:hypothetical protein LP7551_04715 [Roseibium album]|nr:hypothetical protein LP7551_04715 [Roseibium album]